MEAHKLTWRDVLFIRAVHFIILIRLALGLTLRRLFLPVLCCTLRQPFCPRSLVMQRGRRLLGNLLPQFRYLQLKARCCVTSVGELNAELLTCSLSFLPSYNLFCRYLFRCMRVFNSFTTPTCTIGMLV